MYIIYVRNYKRRLIYLLAIVLLWSVMFYLSGSFLNNSLIMNLTINNYLSFSYPLKYTVDNIYVTSGIDNDIIQTSLSFKKPATREFSDYKSVKGNFSFSYPSIFELSEKEFEGAEILYHIDFTDKSKDVHGLVQVWSLQDSLGDFLDSSKSLSKQDFKYFNSKEITVNENKGYLWDYVVAAKADNYKALEVFLEKDDRMYRISYFVPEKKWDKTHEEIFWNIVKSFKAY